MSLSAIKEFLNKRSLAAQFVQDRQENLKDTDTGKTRGFDNSEDTLVGTETNSRLYTLKQEKEGTTKLVLIEGQDETYNGKPLLDESQTPRGKTLSPLQRALRYFKERKENNAFRHAKLAEKPISIAKSNLSNPVQSAVKDYLGQMEGPTQNLSSNFSNLYQSINENARDPSSLWSIPDPDSFTTGYLKPPTQSRTQANPTTSLFTSAYDSTANIINSIREIFLYNDDSYQLPDEKPWEKNRQLADANESIAISSLSSSETKEKHKCKKACRIDSRLKELAASAGVSLDSFLGLDNKTLSKILLNRGVSPFRMLGIFEDMGKNFLSSLAILQIHGKEHLFSNAIAKGLDLSSSSAADQYALQLSEQSNSFIA